MASYEQAAAAASSRTVDTVAKRKPKGHLNPTRAARPDSLTSLCREIGACVYFIRTDDGLIKIGHTERLADRKRQFGSGWDRILAVLPGTRDDEAVLHTQFAALRVRGREFYASAAPLVEHINEIRRRYRLAPVEA